MWNKKFSAAASISFDEGILRSSQSETFKKGHKINTGIFYRKNANFFPINVLYKIFQIRKVGIEGALKILKFLDRDAFLRRFVG